MKYFSILLIFAAFMLAGCGSVANNTTTNANLRGTNTNTGYVTNANATVKPTVPPDATNITPGNLTNGNSNTRTNSNVNSNTNRPR